MTRWFFLFFLALILIISFRLVTFSSAPINTVACNSVSIESDLSGIWDLNRIENFSGFKPYLIKADLENYSFLINSLMPFFLSNSQILIVDICEEKMLLSYNYFLILYHPIKISLIFTNINIKFLIIIFFKCN